jgi:hypothetical protein
MKKILLLKILILTFFVSVQSNAGIVDDIAKKHNLDLSDYHGDYCKLAGILEEKILGQEKWKGIGFKTRSKQNEVFVRQIRVCDENIFNSPLSKLPVMCESRNRFYLMFDKQLKPIAITPISYDDNSSLDNKYDKIPKGYFVEVDTKKYDIGTMHYGKKQDVFYWSVFRKKKPKNNDLSYIKTNGCYVEQLYIAN